MLTQHVSRSNSYKDIGLFTIGTLLKLFVLHYFMGLEEGLTIITLKNYLTIIAMYCLLCLIKENKRINSFLITNVALSIIFFIDSMYYSHFYTLAPIHGIYQLGQLGPVSQSILSLIRPQYLLFFIDSFILWRYYRRDRKQTVTEAIRSNKKQRLALLMTFLILFMTTLGMTYKTVVDLDGNYTPQSLGVINYHLFDAVNFFVKSPLDVARAEQIVETIDNNGGKNGYKAAFNKNVIVIQAESLQSFVLNKEIEGQMITPVLNELISKDSIYFSRFYEQVGWGNTSDAEFVSHNGFHPSTKTFSYKAYEDNNFATLPMLLKEQGYSSIAFHGNKADFWNRENIYPSQGLDTFISLEELNQDQMIGIGLSDGSLFRQSIPYLKKQVQPFYGFYVTLTSHHPFTIDEQYKGLNIQGEYKDTLLEDYLQTVHYLDKQIGSFIEMLKKEGLYEDTMIVIYGDHEGLDMRNEEANELLSSFLMKPYKEDEMFRVPLIAHIPNSNLEKEINTVGGQIDFFPTMANLLGLEIEPDKTLGKDLMNIDEGFVAKQVHVARGSFIDNEKVFIMSNDAIFENSRAWDINTGEDIDIEECRDGYERALAEVNLSEYILQNNLIPLVREKGIKYIIKHRP